VSHLYPRRRKRITLWDKRLGTNLKQATLYEMSQVAKNPPCNIFRISTTSRCTSPATTPPTWHTTTWSRRSVRMRSFGTCHMTMLRQSYKVHCIHFYTAKTLYWKSSKQIFPEKELLGISPNFHIHVSVSDLYIPRIGLPILLRKICGPYKSLTVTWMWKLGLRTDAPQFLFWKYINRIFVAV
jgi:hypothetical protein